MLHGLLGYIVGPKFNLSVSLTPAQVRGLIAANSSTDKKSRF